MNLFDLGSDIFTQIIILASIEFSLWFNLRISCKKVYNICEQVQDPIKHIDKWRLRFNKNPKLDSYLYLIHNNPRIFGLLGYYFIEKFRWQNYKNEEKIALCIKRHKLEDFGYLENDLKNTIVKLAYYYNLLELLKEIANSGYKFECYGILDNALYCCNFEYLKEILKIHSNVDRYMTSIFTARMNQLEGEYAKDIQILLIEYDLVDIDSEFLEKIIKKDSISIFKIIYEKKILNTKETKKWIEKYKPKIITKLAIELNIVSISINNNYYLKQEIQNGKLEQAIEIINNKSFDSLLDLSEYIQLLYFEETKLEIIDYLFNKYNQNKSFIELLLIEICIQQDIERMKKYATFYNISKELKNILLNKAKVSCNKKLIELIKKIN